MTDLEIYLRWLRFYESAESAYMRGDVTLEIHDRAILNMEERLGVNNWSVDRWRRAQSGREEGL